MSHVKCLALAASLFLAPMPLAAQRCMGGVSFADRRAQIGVDVSFDTTGRSESGSLSVGSPRGPFVSAAVGMAHNDELEDAATRFAGTAGVALPLRTEAKTQFCPFISVVVINGMASSSTAIVNGRSYTIRSLSSQAYGLGGSIGTTVSAEPAFELVPFASAAVFAQTTTIYSAGPTDGVGHHHYAVSVGAGALVGKLITFRPSLTLMFAEGRTNTSAGLHGSLSFGRVSLRPPPGPGEGSLTSVWVNTRAGVYYCPGSRSYGATPQGTFMTEREALATGVTSASGRRCEPGGPAR